MEKMTRPEATITHISMSERICMEAESIPVWVDPKTLSPVDMDCDWCGAGVSLHEGEFCGVCIDCGMVMFRDMPVAGRKAPGPGDRPAARSDCQPVTSCRPPL